MISSSAAGAGDAGDAREQVLLKIDGKLHATPLFVALLFLEMTDIVFAVDSVPAIFALTREPLIVFTSNIFAILGLRNLYFLLRGALDKILHAQVRPGHRVIFVGLKMTVLNKLYGGHFPITYSLASSWASSRSRSCSR
jgi:tellurite resistance protein TerC